jgi:hypothetical protein
MFVMNMPKGPDTPNLVTRLRQMADCIGKTYDQYPEWFQEATKSSNDHGNSVWRDLFAIAADELEQMQKLNGKLYSTLYP